MLMEKVFNNLEASCHFKVVGSVKMHKIAHNKAELNYTCRFCLLEKMLKRMAHEAVNLLHVHVYLTLGLNAEKKPSGSKISKLIVIFHNTFPVISVTGTKTWYGPVHMM